MKTRLIIVRHAEAEGNQKRVFHGWTDGEITDKGHIQARLAAERLRDTEIDVIYSSSLKRTLQTAGYIARIKQLPIVRTDKLKEINGGDWEGKRWDLLPQKWPREYDTWENAPHLHTMPNGESMTEFQRRLIEEIQYIVNCNIGKNICIVTHGTAIKALLCYFHSCDLEEMFNIRWCDNTAITIIDYEDGRYSVVTEGDTSHLGSEYGTVENQDWWEDYINKLESSKKERRQDMAYDELVNRLFETKAVRICPGDKPFWYTSGTIGPYYINTHFLYGSEEKACKLLEVIKDVKHDKLGCPGKLLGLVRGNYDGDDIYRGLIDDMTSFVKSNIDVDSIDYISGGERRDWFFSLLVADLLGKPHITIYKDMSAVLNQSDKAVGRLEEASKEMPDITGARVLHIADLITEASSYERAWIPAIEKTGGKIAWSVVVVDRMQGGGELLEKNNVRSFAMVSIDSRLFQKALDMRLIDKTQYEMLLSYLDNPVKSMKEFLQKYPGFLENSLKGDEKTRERANLCLEKGFYK